MAEVINLSDAQKRALQNPSGPMHPNTRRALINRGLMDPNGNLTDAGKAAAETVTPSASSKTGVTKAPKKAPKIPKNPDLQKLRDAVDSRMESPADPLPRTSNSPKMPGDTGVVARVADGTLKISDFATEEELKFYRTARALEDKELMSELKGVWRERMNQGATPTAQMSDVEKRMAALRSRRLGRQAVRADKRFQAAQRVENAERTSAAAAAERDLEARQAPRLGREGLKETDMPRLSNAEHEALTRSSRPDVLPRKLAEATKSDLLPTRESMSMALGEQAARGAQAAPTTPPRLTVTPPAARPAAGVTPIPRSVEAIPGRGLPPLSTAPTADVEFLAREAGRVGEMRAASLGQRLTAPTPATPTSVARTSLFNRPGSPISSGSIEPIPAARSLPVADAEFLGRGSRPVPSLTALSDAAAAPAAPSLPPLSQQDPLIPRTGAASKLTPLTDDAVNAADDVARAGFGSRLLGLKQRFMPGGGAGGGGIGGGGGGIGAGAAAEGAGEAAASAGLRGMAGRIGGNLARVGGPATVAGLAGMGIETLDPEDEEGFELTDVGQGLSGAGIGATLGAVGAGIAGIASGPAGWIALGAGALGGLWNALRGHGDSPEERFAKVKEAADKGGLPWDADDQMKVESLRELYIAQGASEEEAATRVANLVAQAAEQYLMSQINGEGAAAQQMTPELYMALQAQYQKALADSQAYYGNIMDTNTAAQLQSLSQISDPSLRTSLAGMTSAARERSAYTAWASQLAALTAPTLQMYNDEIERENQLARSGGTVGATSLGDVLTAAQQQAA